MKRPEQTKGLEVAYAHWKDSLATGEGVEAASEELFRLLRWLAGCVVWNTLNRHDSQLEADIVTLAFLKAKNFRGESNFATWFWRLAYNQCLKDLRAKRHRKEIFLDDLLEEPLPPAKPGGEFIERFASLRASLSREDVDFIEKRLEGYSVREIGEMRGWAETKAETEWRACRNRVRKLLGAEYASSQ